MRVIRSYWKDWPVGSQTFSQIPEVPPFNDVIYVYGEAAKADIPTLEARGYTIHHVDEAQFNRDGYVYGRKLISLLLGTMDFGEVLMLDWDCVPTREVDLEDPMFQLRLKEGSLLVPVYAHPNQRYSYQYEENHFISPNFGFVYCADQNAAHRLFELAVTKNLDGCVEEHAMYLYATELGFTSWQAYVNQFQPKVCYGVNPEHYVGEQAETENGVIQLKTFELVDSEIEMDIYFKHV